VSEQPVARAPRGGIGFGGMVTFRGAFGGGAGLNAFGGGAGFGFRKQMKTASVSPKNDDSSKQQEPPPVTEIMPAATDDNDTTGGLLKNWNNDAPVPPSDKSSADENKDGGLTMTMTLTMPMESVSTPSESPARNCSKSPMPSLEEATFCSAGDSLSDALTGVTTDNENNEHEQGDKETTYIMPKDVSFNTEKGAMQSHLDSPLVSPDGWRAGIGIGMTTPDLKPICDPSILRTLAIPSSGKDNNYQYHFPPPRTCVGPGLYEC
jgi:hypothetical protein